MSMSIDEFCENGFVAIRGAVSNADVRDCVAVIERCILEGSHRRTIGVGAHWFGPSGFIRSSS